MYSRFSSGLRFGAVSSAMQTRPGLYKGGVSMVNSTRSVYYIPGAAPLGMKYIVWAVSSCGCAAIGYDEGGNAAG